MRLSVHDISNSLTEAEDFDVAEVIPYPTFNLYDKYDDIGLIRLARSVNFNAFIRPACLPEEYSMQTEFALENGWRENKKTSTYGNMKMLRLKLHDNHHCDDIARSHLRNGINPQTQLCAGLNEEGKKYFDLGGPLQVYHSKQKCVFVISGIQSIGDCGEKYVGLYTRVYSYLDWIENIVWPN